MVKGVFISIISISLFILPSLCYSEQVVTVLYYDNLTNDDDLDWLRKGFSDMLMTDLFMTGELKVVERENLEKILAEQNLILSGLTDESTAFELGQLLNAQIIIYGSFLAEGESVVVNTKVADAESGVVRQAVRNSGNRDDILSLQGEMAKSIIEALGLNHGGGGSSVGTSSQGAVEKYYRGLDLFDQGDYSSAIELFHQSEKLDPYFLKPKKTIKEGYQFLKDFRKMRYKRELIELFEKAKEIKTRLAAPRWVTYGEFFMEESAKGTPVDEIQKMAEEMKTIFLCDTPAICLWNLQITLLEIGQKSLEYFDDIDTADSSHREIAALAERSRDHFADDPFLPEILYFAIFSFIYFEQWEVVLTSCEELMVRFPDFRMMWAIEGFYEQSLDKIE